MFGVAILHLLIYIIFCNLFLGGNPLFHKPLVSFLDFLAICDSIFHLFVCNETKEYLPLKQNNTDHFSNENKSELPASNHKTDCDVNQTQLQNHICQKEISFVQIGPMVSKHSKPVTCPIVHVPNSNRTIIENVAFLPLIDKMINPYLQQTPIRPNPNNECLRQTQTPLKQSPP